MSDRRVVEGAAAPLDTDAIRIGAEERKSQAALVADREALLEQIRQLENQLQLVARTLEPIAYPGKKLLGGHGSAVAGSGGDS